MELQSDFTTDMPVANTRAKMFIILACVLSRLGEMVTAMELSPTGVDFINNLKFGGRVVASRRTSLRLPLRSPVPSDLRIRLPLVCAGYHPSAAAKGGRACSCWPRAATTEQLVRSKRRNVFFDRWFIIESKCQCHSISHSARYRASGIW